LQALKNAFKKSEEEMKEAFGRSQERRYADIYREIYI